MPIVDVEKVGRRIHLIHITFRLNQKLHFELSDPITIIPGDAGRGMSVVLDVSEIRTHHIPQALQQLNGTLIESIRVAMTAKELAAYRQKLALPSVRSGITNSPIEQLLQHVAPDEPSLRLHIHKSLD